MAARLKKAPSPRPEPARAEGFHPPSFHDLITLSRERLAAMRRAADDLFEVLELMAREGRHPVNDVLAASPDTFTEGCRYPPPDGVQDAATGSAWYYHAHERPWEEHGHFHCFRYAEHVRPGATPIALPDEPDLETNGLVHMAALCVDGNGLPMRLFTINQWASGEWMYPASDVAPLVDGFLLGGNTPLPLTSRWLSAMLGVCRPQIALLLRERDRVLAERRAIDPRGFATDRSIEITSAVSFDLDGHLAALDGAWQRKIRGTALRTVRVQRSRRIVPAPKR